ncbi:hypothetical protein GTY86_23455 [Streptomyces sp. SID5770]|uniref:hypothetical protein n=1 Tax=Streptomyces sp. SID5770 TaxID=2690308 RepID=UPI00136A6D8B|nr:hypothetical protein [Streptomyces sp. SID5770]MZE54172.1 hypothetical protein [Streptomyces sp. SID5770]
MSTLALLVVLLLALVLPLYLGVLGYVVLRHPRFAQPLTVCGTWAPPSSPSSPWSWHSGDPPNRSRRQSHTE